MHFRVKRKARTDFSFKLGSSQLSVVEQYRYLGVVMQENLDYKITGNKLAEGANRALGKLLGKYYSNKGLGYKTYSALYETCVCPIIEYCAGVWNTL